MEDYPKESDPTLEYNAERYIESDPVSESKACVDNVNKLERREVMSNKLKFKRLEHPDKFRARLAVQKSLERVAQTAKFYNIPLIKALNERNEYTDELIQEIAILNDFRLDDQLQKVLSAHVDRLLRLQEAQLDVFEVYRRRSRSEQAQVPILRRGVEGVPCIAYEYHEINKMEVDPKFAIPLPEEQYVKEGAEPYYRVDRGPPVPFPLQMSMYRAVGSAFDDIIQKYCRPTCTTDAVVMDILVPQKEMRPLKAERESEILALMRKFLLCEPYQPIHWRDIPFLGFPTSTGVGYYCRYKYGARRLSQYTHSPEVTKVTSKAFHSTTLRYLTEFNFRRIIKTGAINKLTDETALFERLAADFLERPSILFARSHVSEFLKKCRIRSVIGVEDQFLYEEMVTSFSLLTQQRSELSCMAWGFETFRGGCRKLRQIANRYHCFISIDWSAFDHTITWRFVDIFYTKFLRSMIVVNKGWQESISTKNDSESLNSAKLYKWMDNILHHLHSWFRNMVFVSTDGFAYRRTHCGIPSGLMNTQVLDSFCNLCLIFDALLEFGHGMTFEEILSMFVVVQGDDCLIYSCRDDSFATEFLLVTANYCEQRWGSKINVSKSVAGSQIQQIDYLGVRINEGYPSRPIDKLVAQLLYPERKFLAHVQASRAVGMAYAAYGNDAVFHELCHQIYKDFRGVHKPTQYMELDFKRRFDPHESGNNPLVDLHDLKFPQIHEIQKELRFWKGPLNYEPRWPKNYFLGKNPFINKRIDHDYITMSMYEEMNNITIRPIKMINYDKLPDVYEERLF